MQKFPLFLGLSATILTLGACKSFMNPTFMPAGYAHHEDNYKAPDGPEAWDIGYDYTRAENAAVLNRWKMVAADLTDKIEQGAPLDAAPIFLSSPTIDNAFTLSLDHALREEFRTRGSKTLDRKFSLKLLSKYSFLITIQHYTSRSTIYYLP